MFDVGQEVDLLLTGAGFTTSVICTILKIKGGKVWLDNGFGNTPSGPFSNESGEYIGDYAFPGFSHKIKGVT